jgi:site-specific DNA recombinase
VTIHVWHGRDNPERLGAIIPASRACSNVFVHTCLRAAIYADSTANQNEQSLADQVDRCRRWADKHSHTVVQVYKDAAISGTTLARPALDQLRADAVAHRFDVVLLLDEVTRISRDIGGMWALVLGEFEAAGIKVVDCLTGMDSSNPNVKLAWGMSGLISTMMIETTKAKTHGALSSLSTRGFHTGGPCYGYRSVSEGKSKVLVIDPAEAETIRTVYARYASGESCRKIAVFLNAENAPAPNTGSKKYWAWGATTVRFILRNRRYTGWNRRRFLKNSTSGKRRRVARPKEEWITVENPELAIITPDLFDRVQARFRNTPGGGVEGSTRKHSPSPLRGLVKCGLCGGAFTIYTRKTTKAGRVHTFLRCGLNTNRPDQCRSNVSISVDRLLAHLNAEIYQRITVHNAVEELIAQTRARFQQFADQAADTAQPERDLAAARARMKNVADGIAVAGSHA